MSDDIYLINTPIHTRIALPDGVHVFDSQLYGDQITLRVIRLRDYRTRESFQVSLKNPHHAEISGQFLDFAKRKYKLALRHKHNMAADKAMAQGSINRELKRD